MGPIDAVFQVTLPGISGFHGGPLHVAVDSLNGIVIGVALVAAYLTVLRRIDRRRSNEESRPDHSSDQRSQNP